MIKNQTASIKYRLGAIIKDNKIGDSEVVPLAFIIEESRNLITPYALLSNIDFHSVEDVYPELNTSFGTAWNQVNVAPRYASVSDIGQMIEALDAFMAKVQYLYETQR
ncbi:hypothetical protein [Cohnella thailandensis]|uniref:Uncharacterized protein n=1 Tax=Cohnella thailandensis TaxID=557557 RepID=A0A841SUA4_9BACL|nr:hypothetical protein [Cohnella thailandensis]MBB6634832.1 hypothetical protein [Cohnella thailandensis]MBP1975947.1 hypothetical protein [Cohnella thailandensis]